MGAVALAISRKKRDGKESKKKRDGRKALHSSLGPGPSSPRSEEGRGLGRRDAAKVRMYIVW